MTETGAAAGQMDVRRIMAMLPHRYPMLLVDRVLEIVPDHSIRAVKAVSMNEPFFQGHFPGRPIKSEEHTSELQSLMRISYAVFCLKKKKHNNNNNQA